MRIKYSEMTKFLNNHGIMVMQPVIANAVDAQLEHSIDDNLFEEICDAVFNAYLENAFDPDLDIWYLVDNELTNRGLKESWNDEDDVPSSTRGDYSPSNPWDAPGMSIKDFI